MFSVLLTRSQSAFAPGNPNTLATAVAAEVGAALAAAPDASLEAVVRRSGGGARQAIYVLMKDGREASQRDRSARAGDSRPGGRRAGGAAPETPPGSGPTGPVVTAPVQIDGELRGLVVLPPPPPRGPFSEVGRLLSLPGTLVLLAAAALVGAVIFLPVRRRLQALERAAERIGAGDRDVRADDRGRDEIAGLAGAFNRMSAELSARTDALHAVRSGAPADARRRVARAAHAADRDARLPRHAGDARCRARRRRPARAISKPRAAKPNVSSASSPTCSTWPGTSTARRRSSRGCSRSSGSSSTSCGATSATPRPPASRCATTVSADADQVLADPGRLEQVVGNLVANALRHTPSGGTIRLEAAIRGGQVLPHRRGLRRRHPGGAPAARLRSVLQGRQRPHRRPRRQRPRPVDRQGDRRAARRHDRGGRAGRGGRRS